MEKKDGDKMIFDGSGSLFGNAEGMPERTGDIKKVHIKDKLVALGQPLESLNLGNFDFIGEYTAKKNRSRDSELYRKVGAFFRPNYERGLLIYALIKHFNVKSYVEIGFGRGYSCFCAAYAFSEIGGGEIITIDPALNREHIQPLANVFPKEWFQMINFYGSDSDSFFKNEARDTYDMIYIDGDHRYEFVKRDWENSRNRYQKVLLFDDYHLPGKTNKDIEVSSLVDSIEDDTKELVIMDRRVFVDDRGYSDDEIDYGQVILTK